MASLAAAAPAPGKCRVAGLPPRASSVAVTPLPPVGGKYSNIVLMQFGLFANGKLADI